MKAIDADKIMKELEREVEMADDWKTVHEIANVVKYAPTVEAVPVVHGRWVNMKSGDADCSVCGRHVKGVYDDDNADRFCRCCGAKMDGDSECETCKWRSDDFTSVCVNGDSEHCADFVSVDDTCECWEGKDDGQIGKDAE